MVYPLFILPAVPCTKSVVIYVAVSHIGLGVGQLFESQLNAKLIVSLPLLLITENDSKCSFGSGVYLNIISISESYEIFSCVQFWINKLNLEQNNLIKFDYITNYYIWLNEIQYFVLFNGYI